MKDSSDHGDQPTLDGDSLPADSLRTQDASGPPFVPMTDGQGDPSAAGVPQIKGYQVRRKIGDAGQGSVWQAVQLSTGREVAMKFLHAGTFSSDNARARFEREIRLTARLNHRNITAVYDSGLHHGAYYYAMEYVEGVHLDQYVRQNVLDQRGILELMRLICLAVQHAHQRGIIHRDLKPSNILVTPDGQPHVLDFGLAKTVTAADRIQVSMEGDAPGTLPFMSPEQAAGKVDELDTRTDIYSLGVILYNLLTGRFPHDLSGTVMAVRRRISEEDILRPRTACADIDKELEALLLKALTQRTDDRYESAAELARDIENYLTGEPLLARPQTLVYFVGKRLRKYRLYVGIASAVMLVLMGGAIFAYVKITIERNRAEESAEVSRRALYFNSIQFAQSEMGHTAIARVKELLNSCPADLRGWEWYRMRHDHDQSFLTLDGIKGKVFSVAVSPDGSRTLSAGYYGHVQILDSATGRLLWNLQGLTGTVYSACWTASGACVAAMDANGTICFWDTKNGKALRKIETPVVTATYIRPWDDWIDNKGRTCFIFGPFRPRSITYNPFVSSTLVRKAFDAMAIDASGKHLAVAGSDETVRIMDASTGSTLKILLGHQGDVNTVAFSPDGRLLASGGQDKQLIVWDAIGGDEMCVLSGNEKAVYSVAFSPDGNLLASGGEDSTVRLWNTHHFKAPACLRGHSNYVTSVCFTSDSKRLLSASWDKTIGVWEAPDGKHPEGKHIAFLRGHTGLISTVAAWPSGDRFVSGGQDGTGTDGTVKIWDLASQNNDHVLFGHSDFVMAATFIAGGQQIVSGGVDHGLKLWNTSNGKEDKGFFRASAATGRATSRPAEFQAGVLALAALPDGQHFATAGTDGLVRIWDFLHDIPPQIIGKHADVALSVAVSPDGTHIASGGRNGVIQVWNGKGQAVQLIEGLPGQVKSLAFSGDGQHLAAGCDDGPIRIYALATGRQTRILSGHTGAVWCLAFSPDGSQLASGGEDRSIRLWTPWEGRQTHLLTGHANAVYSIAFNPTGSRLVSGSADRTVRVWDTWSGVEAITLYWHSGAVWSVSFSADGKKILSSSADSTVRIWDSGKWDTPNSADVVQPN